MVLSAVGDALGYKNGNWEFCTDGLEIHEELKSLGGLDNIMINSTDWKVSDDTVMHIATAKGLANDQDPNSRDIVLLKIAEEYKNCIKYMGGRAPGVTCLTHIGNLRLTGGKYEVPPFNKAGGGCGAAMRAMCIGLRYAEPDELDELICISIESGRMSHHHPTGYLGSLAAALFTAYAVQGKAIEVWGKGLMETLPQALDYIKKTNEYVEPNEKEWDYFENAWKDYLTERNIADGNSKPQFPEKYGIEDRDNFYRGISWDGWGGASGHDAPMIAYDAMLGYNNSWSELCNRAMFHGGDSDSTGVMAGCWYGVLHGYKGVNKRNYEGVEFKTELEDLGKRLYELAVGDSKENSEKTGRCTDTSGSTEIN